ncbi:RidA family protein [Pseudogracilibacillus auburnensis]|uniref:Enamine deaminase RidA (YjgF/YER057c/UK114 family) n=1 Tax=Pseudogracilibacillus auburnensis TaxID=1494959 RepID=A0A2V3W8N6_9BACI|nr:RidA family protein [Pseudogracilibacillus auburnensis]PXW90400.1 enamine deaminase RidA (YjgF/YER057c/UK114 family) [Pseudogracilibacillus auburnensis]
MNRKIFEEIKQSFGYKPTVSVGTKPYVGIKVDGNTVYVSGNIAFSNGEVLYKGRIGETLSVEEGKKSAQLAMINCLDILDNEVGLEKVETILKVTGYLCCADQVTEHPDMMNAASQLLVDIFGEAGKHARAALGMHTLPLGASVEIEFTAKLKP